MPQSPLLPVLLSGLKRKKKITFSVNLINVLPPWTCLDFNLLRASLFNSIFIVGNLSQNGNIFLCFSHHFFFLSVVSNQDRDLWTSLKRSLLKMVVLYKEIESSKLFFRSVLDLQL